ncbi:RHS repeat-associated core domain-containing protein [Pseudomonas sp. C1C7]|uniref:RHS repeat-associated core domain-containing protein n=1 Tax=Pseudomonas sp. C1C7 TaxID=2735272 RepID=UPI0015864CE5|nr:RHS repeat-associated core domain-containing protein [Pseudomonas sp. C1C7]NUT73960.1 RHS repeat-associated core domain-containing protein [Pseudomonas sp. C1C7]
MSRTLLLAADHQNSILAELAASQPNSIAYAAYGGESAPQAIATHLGFNGQLCERKIGWYLLGKGYRAYNPILMRFHSPDGWSPFGSGGRNAYMYCAGDPRNFTDPTGHMLSKVKLLLKPKKALTGAASTSSLSPLTSNAAEMATSAPPQTIPALARETHTKPIVTESHFIDYGPWRETPLPIPSKKAPRFNDTGGQVSILSPNQTPGKPSNYHEAWKSQPFKFPYAPVPPSRTLKSGATREYYVTYDANGNPTQSSVQKMTLPQLQSGIRAAKK